MRALQHLFFAMLLLGISSVGMASEAYIGQFLYKYKAGNTYRVTVNNASSMKWECTEGTEKGARGEETPQRFKVNNHVFFTTWVEKTGVNVTQVLDFRQMKVYSTVVDGQARYVLEGKIIREM